MVVPTAYLVETIPYGLEDLSRTDGVGYTHIVLERLVSQAQQSIDLTVMYWSLLADPHGSEEMGLTSAQLDEMGAYYGRRLYQALIAAAERGVRIRILQSPGFDGNAESARLARLLPEQIEVRQIDMGQWYGDGIMHQKLWVFDKQHVYIGSANMDWRSLTQVKEMGIVVENEAEVAQEALRYFEVWWSLVQLSPITQQVFDPVAQVTRTVPSWSTLLPVAKRTSNPLSQPDSSPSCSMGQPMPLTLHNQPGTWFLTRCPPELCTGERTSDLAALHTLIQQAEQTICLSVMDFVPASLYRAGETIWWPLLTDALLQAMLRGVQVRLLLSLWRYSPPMTVSFWQAWQEMALSLSHLGQGAIEVRFFIVPGWDQTEGNGRLYPAHTRVNHTKYIVTDKRLSIGTSNLTWDYFHNSAGCSFNTDHPHLVTKLQEVFDRDWHSTYAHPLPMR